MSEFTMFEEFEEGLVKKELHIFYVLDTSGSMFGAPITALNEAMRDTVKELSKINDDSAEAAIKLAVLSYNTSVQWITKGIEDIEDFVWSDLAANGMTNLGAALEALRINLSREGLMKSATGNKVPVIIFMSDGCPNDTTWKDELKKLKENKWYNTAIKIAFALGNHADKDILGEVVGADEAVISTNDLGEFKSRIRIVSVASSLTSINSTVGETDLNGSSIVENVSVMADEEDIESLYSDSVSEFKDTEESDDPDWELDWE